MKNKTKTDNGYLGKKRTVKFSVEFTLEDINPNCEDQPYCDAGRVLMDALSEYAYNRGWYAEDTDSLRVIIKGKYPDYTEEQREKKVEEVRRLLQAAHNMHNSVMKTFKKVSDTHYDVK